MPTGCEDETIFGEGQVETGLGAFLGGLERTHGHELTYPEEIA